MSSIQLLGHSMERLHHWVFHAPKVTLGAGAGFRGVHGPHFRPKPGPSPKYTFEARFSRNAEFVKWVRYVHSLFVSGNATECNVYQEEKLSRSYQGWRHVSTKRTTKNSAIGMKSRFIVHRFLKQTKNRVSDWSFRSNAIGC